MRILCINLQRVTASPTPSFSDAFLRFSSKIESREQKTPDGGQADLLFIDITASSHLFGGEDALLAQALKLAQRYYPGATAAISDTPQGAQVFTNEFSTYICAPGCEKENLGEMPLTTLIFFEGLCAWDKPQQLHHIISLFQILGLRYIGEVYHLKADAFRERWGKLGETLWKRLHQVEKQVVSPLNPMDPLKYYVYLDAPLSLLSFLLYYIEKSLSLLVDRMQGRALYASTIRLNLRCEYSDKMYSFEVALTPPTRDLQLFLELVESKLSKVSLENPIREIEVEVVGVPEKIHQTSFFEPQTADGEKLQRMVHLFRQVSAKGGFLQIKNSVFPELSFALTDQPQKVSPTQNEYPLTGDGLRKLPAYGGFPRNVPRPTRLLKKPLRLTPKKVQEFQNLFPAMKERLEDRWWESQDTTTESRDYHFALSRQGQLVWIFKSRQNQQYYLHGYCD